MAELETTWAERELPILRAVLGVLDAGKDWAYLDEIRQELAFTVATMRAGVRALETASPPYVHVDWGIEREDFIGGTIDQVSERGRREIGTWPSADAVLDQLVGALSHAAEEEPEPERKSRLRAAADALGGMARDIATAVIAA